MAGNSEIPEPWATAMENVRAVSPQTGKPSLNKLAEMAKVHTTTVSKVVYGRTRVPGFDTVAAIADALNKSPREVAEWIGTVWDAADRVYDPPPEIALLDGTERQLISDMIRALARSKTVPTTTSLPSIAVLDTPAGAAPRPLSAVKDPSPKKRPPKRQ